MGRSNGEIELQPTQMKVHASQFQISELRISFVLNTILNGTDLNSMPTDRHPALIRNDRKSAVSSIGENLRVVGGPTHDI